MLQISSRDYIIDRQLFEETIGVDGFDMYIDTYKYSILEAEVDARYYTVESLLEEKIRFITYNQYHSVSSSVVATILEEYFNVETLGGIKRTSRGSVSLDITGVFKPLVELCRKQMRHRPIYYTLLLEFCNLYIEYSKMKQFSESLRAKRRFFVETNETDNFGNKLSKISSLYERQSTGRYYTNSDNLQGWNLESVPTFTAPKDYFFVWADFDQIDLRVAANLILFNGHPEVIEQFNRTEDKYEAVARIVAQKIGRPFDVHKFKAIRKSYKTAVLARLYGASKYTLMRDGFTDVQEIDALDEYYNQHEFYQKYVSRFERAIAFNTAVMIEDYFGNIRELPIPQNEKARSRTLEQCLNTPIQSTSNAIVMLWVNELTKTFRMHGFGWDKFRVALLRHDEGLFLVHKDCIPYLWIFELCSSIFIDSWSELTVKPKFGYNYKVVDEKLTEMYNKSVQDNLDILTTPKQIAKSNKDWIPCKSLARATFFAPMSPAMFAYLVLSEDPDWSVDVAVLKEKIDAREPDAVSFAKGLIESYKSQPVNKSVYKKIMTFISDYNKYFNTCIVQLMDSSDKVRLTTKEFIPYLKEHGVGYVHLHNTLLNSYTIQDGIQIKYSTDALYEEITERLSNNG